MSNQRLHADLHGISQLSFSRMFMDVIDTMSKSLRNIHFQSGITHLIRAKADFMKVADFLGMSRDAL